MNEYGLEDFVKGRVDNETLDRIARKADELQRENLSKGYEVGEIPPEQLEKQKKRPYLSEEDKAIADKAAKLIARDYGETLRELADE